MSRHRTNIEDFRAGRFCGIVVEIALQDDEGSHLPRPSLVRARGADRVGECRVPSRSVCRCGRGHWGAARARAQRRPHLSRRAAGTARDRLLRGRGGGRLASIVTRGRERRGSVPRGRSRGLTSSGRARRPVALSAGVGRSPFARRRGGGGGGHEALTQKAETRRYAPSRVQADSQSGNRVRIPVAVLRAKSPPSRGFLGREAPRERFWVRLANRPRRPTDTPRMGTQRRGFLTHYPVHASFELQPQRRTTAHNRPIRDATSVETDGTTNRRCSRAMRDRRIRQRGVRTPSALRPGCRGARLDRLPTTPSVPEPR